jgi:hypothetical protein
MLVLFDHGTPAPLRSFLKDHIVKKTKDLGWDTLSNGLFNPDVYVHLGILRIRCPLIKSAVSWQTRPVVSRPVGLFLDSATSLSVNSDGSSCLGLI